jgi:hypothetical protein
MQSVRPDIRAFFDRYERAGNALDTDVLADCFHDEFLNLDPHSANAVTKEALLAAVPMRERMFASIGATGTDLVGLSETPLDELHTLVETTWCVRFEKPEKAQTLSASFLLRLVQDTWRIVLYLNHNDITVP